MPRKRIWVAVTGSLAVSLGIGLVLVYRAAHSVPQFYQQALRSDPAEQQKASSEMFNRSSRLVEQTKRQGRWQALFTADQINGFLAVDFADYFPDVLPPEVRDPRLVLEKQAATFACRWEGETISTVFSITFDVFLSEPNVVAVRIHKARAGLLPIPLSQVLDTVSQSAEAMELPVVWRQQDGDPVALITIPRVAEGYSHPIVLDTLELRDGEIFFAGRTGEFDALTQSGEPPEDRTAVNAEPASRLQVATFAAALVRAAWAGLRLP